MDERDRLARADIYDAEQVNEARARFEELGDEGRGDRLRFVGADAAPGVDRFQEFLYQLVPYDAAKGEEGVTAQGAVLIGLLALIGLSSWKGIEHIHDGFNGWTWTAMGLVGLTLLTASLGMQPHSGGLDILFTGKFFAVLMALSLLGWLLQNAAGAAARARVADHREAPGPDLARPEEAVEPLLVLGEAHPPAVEIAVAAGGVVDRLGEHDRADGPRAHERARQLLEVTAAADGGGRVAAALVAVQEDDDLGASAAGDLARDPDKTVARDMASTTAPAST